MLYLVSQSSIYQFLPLDRFINSKDRKTTSGCNTFCRSQNSEMVDAEMIMKNKGLFQTHLLKLCPKVGHSCNLHVDVGRTNGKDVDGIGTSQESSHIEIVDGHIGKNTAAALDVGSRWGSWIAGTQFDLYRRAKKQHQNKVPEKVLNECNLLSDPDSK